jgi:hypothetical protein
MQATVTEFKLLRDPASPSSTGSVGPVLRSPALDRAAGPGGMDQIWPDPGSKEAQRIEGVARALSRAGGDVEPFVIVQGATPNEGTSAVCTLLIKLSGRLADEADSIDATEVAELLVQCETDRGFGHQVQDTMPAIGDAVVLLLLWEVVDHEYLAAATRLWMVGALVLQIAHKQKLTASDVRAFLAQRLLVPLRPDTAFPQANVRLTRAAAVSDLFVVRSEWRGYARGEVAALKNVMAGETLQQSNKQTRENETTELTETQQTTQEEESQETRTSSELSREVSSLLSASLQGKVGGEVTGTFPGGTYRVAANAEGSIGLSVAEHLAARTAQEAVTKAASRVDTTTRIQRTTRELVKLEDAFDYELKNPDGKNRRGVYRWLDRIERFQVFRIPDRLQLEFQLPNPAEFFKYRLKQAATVAAEGGPPDWNVTLEANPADAAIVSIVDQKDADRLAARYRATDLPPMPKETTSLVDTKTLEAKNVPADDHAPQVVSPVAGGDLEVVIPDGYEAVEVRYFLSGSPARARWARERGNNDNSKPGWDEADTHVFHSIVLEAFLGGDSHYKTDWIGEDEGLDQLLTTQGNNYNVSTGFGDAYARSTSTQIIKFVDPTATPPLDNPVRVRLKLGFKAVGAAHMQVGVQVICRRTAERYAAWRQQVFETLLAAWTRWDREFRSAQQTSVIFGTSAATERSSSENREGIQEELKRQVISWLLEEVPFGGRPGTKPLKSTQEEPWRQFDVDRAIADAPTIQFFEQAFDWPNMGWIFYPYYWAAKDDWLELASHQASDPDYERFLRSGSARVLVPVRKSFEDAVQYWLVYKKPFLGKGLPLPNNKMFVSIASEIRNLTESPVDGEPVEHAWDTRTSTNFVWLEDDVAVPANKDPALGETEATRPLHPIKID